MEAVGPKTPHGSKGKQCRRCGDLLHREDVCPLTTTAYEDAYQRAKGRLERDLNLMHARRQRCENRFQTLLEMETQTHSEELLDLQNTLEFKKTVLKDHFRMENEVLREIDALMHKANSTEHRLEDPLVRDSILARVMEDSKHAARMVAKGIVKAFRNKETLDGHFSIKMKGYDLRIEPKDYDPHFFLGQPTGVSDPFGVQAMHRASVKKIKDVMTFLLEDGKQENEESAEIDTDPSNQPDLPRDSHEKEESHVIQPTDKKGSIDPPEEMKNTSDPIDLDKTGDREDLTVDSHESNDKSNPGVSQADEQVSMDPSEAKQTPEIADEQEVPAISESPVKQAESHEKTGILKNKGIKGTTKKAGAECLKINPECACHGNKLAHLILKEEVDPLPWRSEDVTRTHQEHFYGAKILSVFDGDYSVQSKVTAKIHVMAKEIYHLIQEQGTPGK